ncbi:hypothetical protein [Salmonella phage BIS08P22]|nr:hypothetical protein [Salmonella phage BIS08P22]
MQSFVCLSSVSHHLAIIKLTRACIVDDVGDHTKYRIRDRAPASLRGFLSANLLSEALDDFCITLSSTHRPFCKLAKTHHAD